MAAQLSKAPSWTVEHEPDFHMHPDWVNRRFLGRERYGEVNSWLLACADRVEVDRRAVLLRNPYEVALSIARRGYGRYTVPYVHECITILDGLIQSGRYHVLRFREVTTSKRKLLDAAAVLGINTLTEDMLDLTPVNHHEGLAEEVLSFSEVARIEYDRFVKEYDL